MEDSTENYELDNLLESPSGNSDHDDTSSTAAAVTTSTSHQSIAKNSVTRKSTTCVWILIALIAIFVILATAAV